MRIFSDMQMIFSHMWKTFLSYVPLNAGGGRHRIHDTGHLQLKSIEENESVEYLMFERECVKEIETTGRVNRWIHGDGLVAKGALLPV